MSVFDFKIFFISLYFLSITASLVAQKQKASSEFIYHSVKKQETVYSIAREHGITPEDIYRSNSGSKESIKVGQVLQIPSKEHILKNNQPDILSYKVKKGESLYFIAKKFNCTQEDILRLNPKLSHALVQRGMILKIPSPRKDQNLKNLKQDYTTYRIRKEETYFNLKKRFGVEKEELEKINPELKGGLKEGLVIRIPVKGSDNKMSDKDLVQKAPESGQQPDELIIRRKSQQFNVALYLPLMSELNDSSRLSTQTGNYLEFFEGALIAAENLKRENQKLKLYIYDTHRDAKIVEQLVKKPEFLSLDLIIGPVYPECQKIISDLSGKNHIPMISPLSPDSRFVSGNGYYFQINPERKLRQNGTTDYIIREFQNKNVLYLGNDYNHPELVKLKQHLNSSLFHIYDLWSDERSGIENHLNPEKENIVVLTDPDEARVSVAVTRLNTVSKKYRILLVGLQEYTRMKSINTEYLHNLNLHYLSPYYINYRDRNVCGFIDNFRKEFGTEPSQYAFQGYDVLTGFIRGMRNSGTKFIPDSIGLLQAAFHFQRVSTFGGFVNTNFFIIEYANTYEINCAGKLNVSLKGMDK